MKILYIIGNGFDLWHGLPTSYEAFNSFAEKKLSEFKSYFASQVARSGPWHDFENSLATFDWKLLYDAHDNTDFTAENFRQSETYALEDDLTEQTDNLVTAITTCFHDWIKNINVSSVSRKIEFKPNSTFLTFNYTSTLQTIYEVDHLKITHIHGNSYYSDDLIFGHGEIREEAPEIDENEDSRRTMFTDAENATKYPFYAFQKPVGKKIKEKVEFFQSLTDVTNIIVIGHSLNDIDLPYYKEIVKHTSNLQWLVYCYSSCDRNKYIQQLSRCNVPLNTIKTCSYYKQ